MSVSNRSFSQLSKYKLSRRGRKIQVYDDLRILQALPREIPERTWSEILHKEDNELVCLDIREELVEAALDCGYAKYMEKQTPLYICHCAAKAWMKIIDLHFYRHDPGEDTTAYPPCCISKRIDSWIPDEMPETSPIDTWGKTPLNVVEPCTGLEPPLTRAISSDSLDLPQIEPIPTDYWFPGKINYVTYFVGKDGIPRRMTNVGPKTRPLMEEMNEETGLWEVVSSEEYVSVLSSDFGTDSEVLQKITDYTSSGHSPRPEAGAPRNSPAAESPPPSQDGSMHGAGDSMLAGKPINSKRHSSSRKTCLPRYSSRNKSRLGLKPLASDSPISVISDCRVRNLRWDTMFEVQSETIDLGSDQRDDTTLKKKPRNKE